MRHGNKILSGSFRSSTFVRLVLPGILNLTSSPQTQLAIDTHMVVADSKTMVADTQTKVTDTQTKVTDTQAKVADTQSKVADTQTKVTDTQTKVTDTQTKVTDTHTMVADIHQQVLAGRQDTSGQNRSVRLTYYPSTPDAYHHLDPTKVSNAKHCGVCRLIVS